MALLHTLQLLKVGERINDELYRSTTRERPAPDRLARPLDPWRKHAALVAPLMVRRPVGI